MTDPSKLITVSWSVRHDETEAYVREFVDGQLALTYGPMPLTVVEEFCKERKQAVADLFDCIIRKLNDGQDTSDQTQQVPGQALP